MAKAFPRGIYKKAPGSQIFWIRYTDVAGKERREKCGNITAAKTRLSIRHAEKSQGLHAPQLKSITFGTLIDDALKHITSENDAYAARDLRYKLERIRAAFGGSLVSKITRSAIIEWLESESKNRLWSPASRNRYQAAWSLIFRIAKDNKKVRENPAAGIKRKREDNERTRYLLPNEEPALTSAIAERFPTYVDVFLLALHVGYRKSELLRAQEGDYTTSTGKFRVRQKKVRGAPAYRYVPATPIAIAAYNRLAAGKPSGALLCSKQEKNRSDAELHDTRYWFDPCVQAAKLKDLRWHDLRHTFASRLVMGGVPLAAVSRYMGHQSITMTMRYAHLAPEKDTQAVDIMMSFYAAKGTGTNGAFGVIEGGRK